MPMGTPKYRVFINNTLSGIPEELSAHDEPVSVALRQDGAWVARLGKATNLILQNLETGETFIQKLPLEPPVAPGQPPDEKARPDSQQPTSTSYNPGLCFHPDNKRLLFTLDGISYTGMITRLDSYFTQATSRKRRA